jgi:hypothetical protein
MAHHQDSQGRRGFTERLSFLSLPVELRLKVYEHLIANTVVTPMRPLPRKTLRTDGQPCCPAILRANRCIYEEAIDMWYGTATFCINIHGRFIYFLNTEFKVEDVLPRTFRLVRTLDMQLTLEKPSDRYLPRIKAVTEYLGAGSYKLRHLTLQRIRFHKRGVMRIIGSCVDDQQHVRTLDVVTWNIWPLHRLRGVHLHYTPLAPFWSSSVAREMEILHTPYPKPVALQFLESMRWDLKRVLKGLAKRVSQDPHSVTF